MNDFWEDVKDILHNYIDYIVMILIIGLVIFVITWRLDGLFKPGNKKDTNDVNIEENIDNNSENKDNDNIKDGDENKDTKDNSSKKTGKVSFTIPSGSVSSKIGEILKENNLIKDIKEFEDKVYEMGLESKLKAGDFEIEQTATLEEIIKIITK